MFTDKAKIPKTTEICVLVDKMHIPKAGTLTRKMDSELNDKMQIKVILTTLTGYAALLFATVVMPRLQIYVEELKEDREAWLGFPDTYSPTYLPTPMPSALGRRLSMEGDSVDAQVLRANTEALTALTTVVQQLADAVNTLTEQNNALQNNAIEL